MEAMLARKLIEKGAIRQNTIFEAYFRTHGLSCVSDAIQLGKFKLIAAKAAKDNSRVVFEGILDDVVYKFTNKEILSIDGMPPDRLAAIYDLNINGDPLVFTGKRRRKKSDYFMED